MHDSLKKLGWFAAIWGMSVLAITAVGLLIRAVIAP